METSALLKSLSNVMNGMLAVEDFTSTVVGSAIEDVMLSISRDYGLNYSKLVDEYKSYIIDKHALVNIGGCCPTTRKCTGKTKSNLPCGRRAVCKGFCREHSAQLKEIESSTRKATAYADKKKLTTDPVCDVLIHMGVDLNSKVQFISKPTVSIGELLRTI